MRIAKLLVIIVFLISSFNTIFCSEKVKSDMDKLWLDTYGSCEKADNSYSLEKLSSSYLFYDKAIKKFPYLFPKYLAWNKELVEFQINSCKERVDFLKLKIAGIADKKSGSELIKENLELQIKLVDYQNLLVNKHGKLKIALLRSEKSQHKIASNSIPTEKLTKSKFEHHIKGFKGEIFKIQNKKNALNKAKNKLKTEQVNLIKENNQIQNKLVKVNNELAETESRLSSLKVQQKKQIKKMDNFKNQLTHSINQNERLNQSQKKQFAQLKRLITNPKNREKESFRVQKEKDQNLKQLADGDKQISNLVKFKKKELKNISEFLKEIKLLNENKNFTGAYNSFLENKITKIQDNKKNQKTDIKNLLNKLSEQKDKSDSLKNENLDINKKLKNAGNRIVKLEIKYSFIKKQADNEKNYDKVVFDELREKIAEHKLNLTKTLEDKVNLQKKISSLKKNYKELSLETVALTYERKKNSELEFNLNKFYLKITNLSKEIQRINSVKYYLSENLALMKSRLSKEKVRFDSLRDSLSNTQNTSNILFALLKNENKILRAEVSGSQSKIDKLRNLKEAYAIEMRELKNSYFEVNSSLSKIQTRYITARNEGTLLKGRITEKEKIEFKFSNRINKLSNRLAAANDDYTLLANKYKKLQNNEMALNRALSKNNKLNEVKSKLEGYIKDFKDKIYKIQYEKMNLQKKVEELLKEKNYKYQKIAEIKNNKINKPDNSLNFKQNSDLLFLNN